MTIPTQDGFKIGAQGLPTVRATAPEMADAGAQMTLAGRQAAETGDRLAQMQLQMAQEANELITDDALTRLKDAQMRLRNDPEAGYSRLLGRNALERPDGLSLTDEYDQMLSAFEQEIAAGLKNDAQRQAFAQGANSIRHAFRQELSAHQLRQHQAFVGETAQSNLQSAANVFALADSREEEQAAFMRMTDNLRRLGNIGGWDEATFEAKQREILSGALGKRLDYLIDRGQLDEAEAVLERYRNLNADLVLKSRDRIEQVRDDEAAEYFGAALAQAMDGQGGAVEIGRGGRSVWQSEAANHHAMNGERGLNMDGMTTEQVMQVQARHRAPGGSTGAAGMMQIMPDNLKRGVEAGVIPRNMRWTRENQIRYVGSWLVFHKRGSQIGNYIAGKHENLREAQIGAAQEWAGFQDPRTGRSVYHGIQGNRASASAEDVGRMLQGARAAYARAKQSGGSDEAARHAALQAMFSGSGGGRQSVRLPAGMTAQQAEALIGRLPRNQREAARRAFQRQYGVLRRDREEREAAQTVEMMRLVEEAGGDVRAIPRSVWSGLEPQQRQRLHDFGDRVRSNRQGQAFRENELVYWDLRLNPEKLKGMSENQIMAQGLSIGMDKAEDLVRAKRSHEEAVRKGEVSGLRVQQSVVNDIARMYKVKHGAQAKPEDLQRYYALAENVKALAWQLQQQLGRPPTNEELFEAARKMTAEKTVTERGWFRLLDTEQPTLTLTREERERAATQ